MKKKFLQRRPFRWELDGEICRWCYEMFSMETVLKTHNLTVVEKIDDNTAWVTGELL